MSALRERSFTSAKSELSSVMDEVFHQHQPQLVQRHGGRESMLLIRPDDARGWLDKFRFDLSVVLDEGEVAVSASTVGAIGIGASLDDALDNLVLALRAYVKRFFEKPQFYRETNAAPHEPWLLRFALTEPKHQRALLDADINASMPMGNDRSSFRCVTGSYPAPTWG